MKGIVIMEKIKTNIFLRIFVTFFLIDYISEQVSGWFNDFKLRFNMFSFCKINALQIDCDSLPPVVVSLFVLIGHQSMNFEVFFFC
jgi:hypothetical protein